MIWSLYNWFAIANQRKIPKWLSFKNYRSESLNIWCEYIGAICAYVYQIGKFLCLTMCQGEVCTDDANADANTGRWWCTTDKAWLYKALRLLNQMSQKKRKKENGKNIKLKLDIKSYRLIYTNWKQKLMYYMCPN